MLQPSKVCNEACPFVLTLLLPLQRLKVTHLLAPSCAAWKLW
jgi:hypothetical protein